MKTLIAIVTFVLVVGGLGAGWMYYASGKREEKIAQIIQVSEKNLASGDYQQALALSNAVIEKYRLREQLPQVMAIRARAYEGMGQRNEAVEQWKVLRKDFPASTHAPDAIIGIAHAELDKGTPEGVDAAHELFREIESKYPGQPAYYEALLGFARIDLKDGQLLSAQKTLYRLLEEAPNHPRRGMIEDLLGKTNIQLFRSSIPQEGESIHEIVKGDTLAGLQKKYKVNYELIQLVNGIDDPRRLRLGQKVKIPNINFSIEVDKANNTLTLLNHGKFFKKYRVRTGENDGQTPTGQFKVIDKVKDPVWDHDGTKIPAGDPANELGSRWMAFSGRTLGIHEAIDPGTIGTYSSNGCVGMLKQDVEELYDLVPMGTPVTISGQREQPRRRGA